MGGHDASIDVATAPRDWSQRNQRWLAERFAYWRARLDATGASPAGSSSVVGEPPDQCSGRGGTSDAFVPALASLAALFGLTSFEAELLVLAAGVEADAGLRAAVARSQGAGAREPVRLSYSLALALVPHAHWDAISPLGPLRQWRLLDFGTPGTGLEANLAIDERILHHITGVAAFDERLTGVARHDHLAFAAGGADDATARQVAAALAAPGSPLVVVGEGPLDLDQWRAASRIARAALARAGRDALWVDGAAVASRSMHDDRAPVELARCCEREAALTGAALVLQLDGDTPGAVLAVSRFVAALLGPVLVVGDLAPARLVGLERRSVRRFAVPKQAAALPVDLAPAMLCAARRACRQFHVDSSRLEPALRAIVDTGDDAETGRAVWNALRTAARGGLESLAQRVDAGARLADLVVPPNVMRQLHEIASHLRLAERVYAEWGFGRRSGGLGVAALFAGESGTGKTMAAEAIAEEAGLDLYRIDLASVVSKYIGETEKNLGALFDAAERSGAVLLFDEADALFGKRSEVKDSHDRYANIEVAYLLQRIEAYRGLAILTSNLKNALDRAFMRRIRFVVHFPFPDVAARELIWRRQLPAQAPRAAIDFAALARLPLAGANIRSVALHAAFLAAERGEAIGQCALVEAARGEFAKLDRPPGHAVLAGATVAEVAR